MRALVLACLAWAAVGPPVEAFDLSKVERKLLKEPAYKHKPKYCLLVFGPEAKTRIWLVLDGDTLYVDRNGDGDLTEKGESIQAQEKSWSIGEVVEADGQ